MQQIKFHVLQKSLCSRVLCIGLFFILLLGCSACEKSGGTSSPGTFSWSYGISFYTANIKGAYTQSLGVNPIIIAGTGSSLQSPGTGPSITVPSFNVGMYTLSSTIYTIHYVNEQGVGLGITTGTINITNRSNNVISGNFTATLTNAVTLSGKFSDLPVSQ